MCWEPTVVQHKERPNSMVQFILIWISRNGNYHICQGWGNFHGNCVPHKGNRFGNFMRGSKLWMGVINKQDIGVTSEMIKALFEGW